MTHEMTDLRLRRIHQRLEALESGLARFAELISADQREAWEDALKDAFFEGFTSVATYNDTILNSPEEAWEKYKPSRAKTNK